MPDDEQPPVPPAPSERPRYRQLNGGERVGAIAAAAVVGTMGFVAMFVTKNEAGVAVAVLLAGVLLIIGIQGTQIGKLGGKDIGAEMALREDERQEIVAIATSKAETNPNEARALLEGFQVADPESRNAPEFIRASTFIYQQQVLQALQEHGTDLRDLGAVRIHLGREFASSPDAVLDFGDIRIGIDLGRTRPWTSIPIGAARQSLWDRASHYGFNAMLLLSPVARDDNHIVAVNVTGPVLAIRKWLPSPESGPPLIGVLQQLLTMLRAEADRHSKPIPPPS